MRLDETQDVKVAGGSYCEGYFKGSDDVPSNEDSAVVILEAERNPKIDERSDETEGNLQVQAKVGFLELANMPKGTGVFYAQGEPGYGQNYSYRCQYGGDSEYSLLLHIVLIVSRSWS